MKRAEEMRELFARWKSSGRSLMAFGKQEGVAYSKLLYCRRKFRGDEPSADATELVPVRIVTEPPAVESQSQPFEVWLANGVALNIAAGFDDRELRRLVDVLSTC